MAQTLRKIRDVISKWTGAATSSVKEIATSAKLAVSGKDWSPAAVQKEISEREFESKRIPDRTGGGGGRAPTPPPTLTISAEELRKQQEAEQRTKAAEIQAEQNKRIREAEQKLREQLRKEGGIEERQRRVQEFRQAVAQAELGAKAKKVESRLITGYQVAQVVDKKAYRGVVRAGETKEFQKALAGQPLTIEEAEKLKKYGLQFEEVPARDIKKEEPKIITQIKKVYYYPLEPPVKTIGEKITELKEKAIGVVSKVEESKPVQYFRELPPVKKIREIAEKTTPEALGYAPSLTPEQIQEAPFSKLQMPEQVTKGFFKAGTMFEKFVGTPTKRLLGIETTPEQQKAIGRRLGTLFAFTAFSPLMATGTYQKSEYVYDYTKQRFVKKIDVEKIQTLEALKREIAKSSNVNVKKYIIKQLNLIKNSNLASIEKEKLARELYGLVGEAKGGIVIRDLSGKIVGVEGMTREAVSIKPIVIEIDVSELAQLKEVGWLGAGVSALEPKQVRKVEWLGTTTIPITTQAPETKTKLKEALLTIPALKTEQAVKQDIATKQLSKLATILKTQQLQKQKTKLKMKQEFFRGQPQKQIPKKPTPVPPLILLPKPTFIQRVAKVAEEEPSLFKAFVTKAGKPVEIGEFPTLTAAKEKLVGKLRTTLRAGGWITKADKPLRFEQLGFLGAEFHPSKVSPYKVIEKKEKRLRVGITGKEIQAFRFKKKSKKGLLSI